MISGLRLASGINAGGSILEAFISMAFYTRPALSATLKSSWALGWTNCEPFTIVCAVEHSFANALGEDATPLAVAEKRDLLARLLGRLP